MMPEPILRIEEAAIAYDENRILDGFNLEMFRGQILHLQGNNGSGKSSLLRATAGVAELAGGDIFFKKNRITHISAYKRVRQGLGYIRQSANVFVHLSVEENLDVASRFAGIAPRHVMKRRKRVFELFPEIQNRQKMLAASLSGGQRQMLANAMILQRYSDVFLMDEPSVQLANEKASALYDWFRELADQDGYSFIIVEHRHGLIRPICDVVIPLGTQ